MNAGKLRFWLTVLLLAGAIAVIFRQNQEEQRLSFETENLRSKSADALRLQQENDKLTAELTAVQKRAESQMQELARLRAKSTASTRSEQENIKLKMEVERLSHESASSVTSPSLDSESVEVREKKQLMTRLSFGKTIALSLIMFADEHDGKLPEDFLAATAPLDASPESSSFGCKTSDYDYVISGQLYAVKEPGVTILAREKKPMALSGGKFGKTYIFADGHVELVRKDHPEEFAAWEQEHTEQKVQP